MGNEMRRVISFILALTMAFTSFDVSVWANEDENDIEIVNEVIETDIEDGIVESETEESSQEVDSTENIILSGTWGNNITWTLIPNEEDDSTYTLTLSGSGKIPSNYYVTVPWNDYKDSIGKVVIESGITSVGEYTFRESSNLTEVELPEGLTGIGQYSFYNCRALKKMVIPSSVTSIGNDAFSGCAFTTVGPIGGGYDFEFGCTEVIPAYAFYGNENLVEVMIPEGTKLIGDYAFAYCTSLKKIRIPSSVESVGDAFSGCVFETAGPIGGGYDFEFGWTEEIPAYAFSSAYNLTEVKIPEGITRIGRNAFNYCEALKKISVPGSVKTAAEAFSGCVFETAGPIGGGYDFEFGWTEEIPNRSFVGCEFLSTVTIPEGLEKIGDYAFEYCNSLTEVTIAEGVKEIGNHAFEDCNSLTEVTIAEGLEKIGDYAFLGCDNLVEVNMSKGLQKIGNYAFSDCISLREIDIPEGVKELGEYAFANSYGVSHYYKIRIPESVQKIGRGALGTYSLGNIKTIGPIGGDYDYEFGWTKEFPENAFGNAGDVIGVEKIYIPKTIKYSSYCFPSSDIILGSVGSYAEAHAKLCQISFQAIDEFDVQFETYTEEKVKTQARFVGIKVIEPAILERVGYAFGGWYTSAEIMDDTTKWDFENDVVSQNMTLYAKWTPNACKVSYDLGYEAADVIEAKDVIYDTAYGELPAVVREGYTFLGWYTAKENGTLLTAESIVETTENHTLYAQWKVNQYKVTFDANEGVLEVTEKEVTYGEKYGDLPVPTRKGYTFMGWATELSGGTTVNADTVVQFLSDQTLYAQWKPNKTYEVLLDANGGTVEVEKLTVTFAVEYGELPTPVKKGHTFNGWRLEDGSIVSSKSIVGVDSNHTLLAGWLENPYIVFFESGDGVVEKTSEVVYYNTAYGKLPTPVLEGHTFVGWYTAKKDGVLVTSESIVEVAEHHTLYAKYEPNVYKIIFDTNGGLVSVEEKEVLYNELYGELPVPTREGYIFLGWYTANEDGTEITEDQTVKIVSDQTLYAQWEPNKTYEVLLDANGGTLELEKLTVFFGVEYGELPTPVKKGHTFNGWRLEDGSLITPESIVSIDSKHTLLASWLENPYIVFFESGDGVVEKTSEVVYYNTAYGKLPTPVLEGHTFVGWYTAKKDGVLVTSESIVEVAEHHTLYAKYEPNVYKIIFDTNGGLVSVEEKEVLYNELYGELPVPTREGYIFLGWYTANEDGTEITADQTVKVLTDQTLYAQWEIGKYEVTFDTNGGKIENEKIIVTYHSSYGELPVPTVKGGLFLGWYTEDGALVDAESIVEIGANHTLYAQWYFKYATANPVASIESGIEVDAGTRLYLTTETNGAFIYFTMNEEIGAKVSDENGILYEDAITIVDNVTIYAIAVKPGFERSEVISISYTVHDESEDWGDITEADIAELSELGITSPEEVPQGLWIAGISDCDYIGSAITYSELHVYSYKTLLEENVDYTVKYRNNTKAGTATVAITGKGNYTGTIEKSFIIRPLDLNNASVVDVTLPYNGKVQKATTTVTYVVNGKVMTLKSGSDFTYAYPGTDKKADDYDADAFVVAGNHTVILTGKGNYIGTTTFTETITEKYIIGKMKLTKIKDQPYNKGKSIEPKIELKNGNQKLVVCTEETCTGMCGADVAVKYENNKEVGIATVTLIGVGEYADAGKYVGTMTTTFKITGTPLSKMKLNNFSSSLEWKEGGVIQEEAYFSYVVGGGADLTEGEDYTVAYQKNEEVGTATVIYTGMGGYTGTVKKTYKITGFSMSKAVVEGIQSSVTYNGEDAELSGYKLSYVSEKGAIPQELIEGKHFKVSYKNNGKAGTANIIFTGINEYTGTLKKSFKVIPYNFESEGARISVSDISDALYTKGGTTPKPEVIYYSEDGTPIMLVEGKDYTLKYQNNKAIANATANKVPRMTVIGKGNFTGKLTQTFTIKESDLSGVCMTATNVVYQNKGGLGKTAVTLLDTNGKKLVAGTDYQKTIEYTYAKDVEITHIVNKQIVYETREENDAVEKDDIIPIGAEIKATVKGMKNYTGEQYVIFRVVAADISKATVKVTEQAYTGKAIEPTKDDITVKIGKETLKKTDYEIVSYSNNVKKGTAKVTIRGIGNYGGEKTVTFKINSKKIK